MPLAEARRRQPRAAFGFHLGEQCLDLRAVEAAGIADMRARDLEAHVGREHAPGGEHRGDARHDHAREIELAPPQIMTLAHLSRHATVASALSEAASRPPPLIQPEPIQVDGNRVVCYPGDPGHPLARRAMPDEITDGGETL